MLPLCAGLGLSGSPENGKIHDPRSAFLRKTDEKHKPRTGCGKYQVGVPCESRIP
jgi:hypothetical protein